jgi:hypothetical protein
VIRVDLWQQAKSNCPGQYWFGCKTPSFCPAGNRAGHAIERAAMQSGCQTRREAQKLFLYLEISNRY